MAVTLFKDEPDTAVAPLDRDGIYTFKCLLNRVVIRLPNVEYGGPRASVAANIRAILTHKGQLDKEAGLLAALQAAGLA